ncbi:SRPBCC domain-containing protein [Stappia sp. F7233]|uniref:SRPBCC domain-containing protein n=1 Tax=Stappia albiluteola TaxID=2758565 RepID=A0A839AL97_9HYPH|nr:SRPBCC family protein [Stappia albiluteola]MBA5779219.1 SRPBCC domain-containing protein [Stappia albiluteola]
MSAPDQGCSFTLSLPCSREAAFDLFVDGFGNWWPKDYAFSGDTLQEIGIEPQLGGACYEQTTTGQRIVWGTVLSIERPLYIRLAWQIGPDREIIADPAAASRVMVVFRELREGSSMELTHSEFLRHGVNGEAYREAMASEEGWPRCLEAFRKKAEALARR